MTEFNLDKVNKKLKDIFISVLKYFIIFFSDQICYFFFLLFKLVKNLNANSKNIHNYIKGIR